MMKPGQIWVSRSGDRCTALGPNDSSESPGSWVMRRISDGATLYAHEHAVAADEWARAGILNQLVAWLRRCGAARFGFEEWRDHGRFQILRVWGLLVPSRWEVRKYHIGGDWRAWISELPAGSTERYHRIELSADPVYIGPNWDEAVKRMR